MLAAEDKKQADAAAAIEEARREYRTVLEQACKRLGVDPATVAFDPQTGVVQTG
jgi:hypothetical protein